MTSPPTDDTFANNGSRWEPSWVDTQGIPIRDGIYVQPFWSDRASSYVMARNHSQENGGHGIFAPNVTDGGGNVAA